MTSLILEQIIVGGDRNFGYLLGDRENQKAILIDPSYHPELLVERAKVQGLQISTIFNTHSHEDHINGNARAKTLTGAQIAAFTRSPVTHDFTIQDGQTIDLGHLKLTIFHTPGHCDDHIVIYVYPYHIAFTGDHLFVGKIGGTYSEENAREQYASLKRLFQELPAETTIWPGHDYGCRPSSTLLMEKHSNPFIQANDFAEFLALKASWRTFKQQHGLK